MNRQRKTNRGLPRRVYLQHGAYRYFSPVPIRAPKTGKMQRWIHLAYAAEGESKMLAALGALLGDARSIEGSMPYVCAEFGANKLARYGDETKAAYRRYLHVIADDFEMFHAADVTTKDCAAFLRNNFKDKANTAQKYAALMGKLFRYAIAELGLRKDNPMDQLDLDDYETERREVLITHEQIAAIRAAGMTSKPRVGTGATYENPSGRMFCCIIDMSYLVWQRAIDVRMLKESQIENGRIRFTPSKTKKSSGKVVDITITPSIQAVIDQARDIKKEYGIISPYLLPTQKGTPYAKSGLSSMWGRAKERVGMTADVVFKDIRALGATDAAKAGEQMADIQVRLAHTSSRTSEIYIKEAVPGTSGIDLNLPWKTV